MVALAAGLSRSAISRRPNAERRSQTTKSASTPKMTVAATRKLLALLKSIPRNDSVAERRPPAP